MYFYQLNYTGDDADIYEILTNLYNTISMRTHQSGKSIVKMNRHLLPLLTLLMAFNLTPSTLAHASEEPKDDCRDACTDRHKACTEAKEDDARGAERCTTYAIECKRHCHAKTTPQQDR